MPRSNKDEDRKSGVPCWKRWGIGICIEAVRGGGVVEGLVVGGSADGGRITGWLFNLAFVPGPGLMWW